MDTASISNFFQEPVVRIVVREAISFTVKRVREKYAASEATQQRADKALESVLQAIQEELRAQANTAKDIQNTIAQALLSPRGSVNLENDLSLAATIEEPFTQATLAKLVVQGLSNNKGGPKQGLFRKATESLEYMGERQLRALGALCVLSGRISFSGVQTQPQLDWTGALIQYFKEERDVLTKVGYTAPDLSLLASLGLATFEEIQNDLNHVFTRENIMPALDGFLVNDTFGRDLAKQYQVLRSYSPTTAGLILGSIVLDLIHGRTTSLMGLD